MQTLALRALVVLVPLSGLSGCGAPGAAPATPASGPPPTPQLVVSVPPQPPQPEVSMPPSGEAPVPEVGRAVEPTRPARTDDAVRHVSTVLEGAPRPSRLAPGDYACRTGAEYKFRPCTITRDARGFSSISMPGSLIGFRGVIYDDGARLVLDGASADERPFGCFSCQERCTADPSSCACVELMPAASRECLERPILVKLDRRGAVWSGTLTYPTYFNRYEGAGDDRHVTGWEVHDIKLLVEIAPKGMLPKGK